MLSPSQKLRVSMPEVLPFRIPLQQPRLFASAMIPFVQPRRHITVLTVPISLNIPVPARVWGKQVTRLRFTLRYVNSHPLTLLPKRSIESTKYAESLCRIRSRKSNRQSQNTLPPRPLPTPPRPKLWIPRQMLVQRPLHRPNPLPL